MRLRLRLEAPHHLLAHVEASPHAPQRRLLVAEGHVQDSCLLVLGEAGLEGDELAVFDLAVEQLEGQPGHVDL